MKVQEFVRDVWPRLVLRLVHARHQDALARWCMAGLLPMLLAVVVLTRAFAEDAADGEGDGQVSTVETSQTDRVVGDVLVQGIVVDAATGAPLESFRVLPGVPYGRRPGGQDPACATWQPHLIRQCADGAFDWPRERTYPLFLLRIEADGYVPVTSDWVAKGEATWLVAAKMLRDPGVAGRVLAPSGEPAAGATIAIGLPNRTIRLDGRAIAAADDPLPAGPRGRWRRPAMVKVDREGRFKLPTETDPAAMLCVVHESGYLERPFSQLLADYRDATDDFKLQLAGWGYIAGEVVWKDRPGANEPITLSIMRENIYPELISSYRSTESNAEGRFEFANVPPGRVQLSRTVKIADEDSGSYQFPHARVDVLPGQPTAAIIGGRGVPVVGELTGLDSYKEITVRIQPRTPPVGFGGDNVIWKGYAAVQASEMAPLYFREAEPVNEDGTFRIEAVLPGDYQAFIANEDRSIYKVHSVHVPTEDATRPAGPCDLGRIAVDRVQR